MHAKISPKSFSWSEYNADNKLFMESTRTVLDVTFPNDATNNPTVSCIIPISMDESCPYKCIINKNIVEKIVFIPLDDEIYYANTPMGVLEYSKLTKKLSIGGTGIKSLQLIMDPKQSSVISGSFSFTSKKQIQEDIVHSKKIAVFNDGGGMVSQYNITNPTIFLPNIKICI